MDLSTEVLLNLPDDAVKSFVNSQLVNQLMFSNSVKTYFFSDANEAVVPKDQGYIDNLATAFVCSSIARSSLYGFAGAINQSAADGYWQNGLDVGNQSAIAEGQSLYNWAFPQYCQLNGTKFQDFLDNDPAGWADKLAKYVTAAPFIDTTINKIFAEPGWLDALNLIFYKIDQLDQAKTASVLKTWTDAYPDKSIKKNWDQLNFIMQANFSTIPETFLGAVNAQLSYQTTYTEPPADTGAGGWSQVVYAPEIAYGFLGIPVPSSYSEQWKYSADTLARRLGFLSGNEPGNIGESRPAGACFVVGTSVRLEDGRSIAIESVASGDRVLGQDGGVSVQSIERVEVKFPNGVDVFGFQLKEGTVEPFFYAGHMFWTIDGWKALDPAIAHMENPDRPAGQLKVGDQVFLLKPGAEKDYEKVEILGFTKKHLPENTVLHSLHLLEGPRSFHANGYLVAMNYPVITVSRLKNGFSRLTIEERRFVKKQLLPILPMLDTAIGNFVTQTILTTLSNDNS